MSKNVSPSRKTRKPPARAAAEATRLAAVARDEEETERRRIRALLKLPMHKRTHFLRVRVGNGSAL